MPALKHIAVGSIFGRLIVVSEPLREQKRIRYMCRCSCGTEKAVLASELRKGQQSCGCLKDERTGDRARKHGEKHTAVYRCWENMRSRCENPSTDAYYRYGARGIRVCDRWKDFTAFLADMGEPPTGHQLDRIDNDRNYEPSNCRWVDRKTQMRNTSVAVRIDFRGQSKPLQDWCDEFHINPRTFRSRLRYGWSLEKAFTTPIGAP